MVGTSNPFVRSWWRTGWPVQRKHHSLSLLLDNTILTHTTSSFCCHGPNISKSLFSALVSCFSSVISTYTHAFLLSFCGTNSNSHWPPVGQQRRWQSLLTWALTDPAWVSCVSWFIPLVWQRFYVFLTQPSAFTWAWEWLRKSLVCNPLRLHLCQISHWIVLTVPWRWVAQKKEE